MSKRIIIIISFFLLMLSGSTVDASQCLAPDNGFGTVDLPAPCPYKEKIPSMRIEGGLPPGTTIEIDATFDSYINITEVPSGVLGGTEVRCDATLSLSMTGTGALAGFNRFIQIPVMFWYLTAPRIPGDPVQLFDTRMKLITGGIGGDPDFDVISFAGGNDISLPANDKMELTDLGGSYDVYSYFDITYEFEFIGAPGSVLDGMSGITPGATRIVLGTNPWQPGDDHKMHFPQLPDEEGWNVESTYPMFLADDWECSETGWVKDYHFWGSWQREITGTIDSFNIRIYSDVAAGDDPIVPWSHPGDLLVEHNIDFFDATLIQPGLAEGWYNPALGLVIPGDHFEYYQYDILLPEAMWWRQEMGTIYWLSISAHVAELDPIRWGWKSSVDHFNDDATWSLLQGNPCVVPDNGSYDADLPANCPFVAFNETMDIVSGLPPGTEINSDPTIENYFNIIRIPGGTLGGEILNFDATLKLEMHGAGLLAGFNRTIFLPITCEIHTAPHSADPVKEIPAEWKVMQGIIFGDPDFDQIQVVGGTNWALPSPGHIRLSDDGGGGWIVESFFDFGYNIDFIGAPGSVLDGFSGSTIGTLRINQGAVQSSWIEMYEPPLFDQSLDLSFVITGGDDGCCVVPGDFNHDGTLDISDLTAYVDWLFRGGPGPICFEEADNNGDCATDISDLTYLVDYMFRGGPAPVPCHNCP